jgi:hypothetical protein
MTDPAAAVALRRGVLAVSVLDDVDLVPVADGVQLDLGPDSAARLDPDAGPDAGLGGRVPWAELAACVGPVDPESEPGRARLRDWLRVRRYFAEMGSMAAWRVELAAVPLGLPTDHPLHPGPEWVREAVLGGAVDLGIGLRGLVSDDPDGVVALPPALTRAVGLDPSAWWTALRVRLEDMGALTVDRLRRDGNGLITPMGGCDVVTLLGSRALRAFLAGSDGTGMRGVAVPMRSRGWFDLARIDPAFVSAAAAATDEVDRGFWRPLLVTRDEVATGLPGGDVRTIVLRDPAAADVLWRL